MSRELLIAMGTGALPIIGALLARWEVTVELVRGQRAVEPYLFAITGFLCLLATPIIGTAAAASRSTPGSLGIIQIFGIEWGLMMLVGPLLMPLIGGLADEMNDRARLVVRVLLFAIVATGIVTIVFIAVEPWYLAAVLLIVAPVIATLELRYGSPIERLLGRHHERQADSAHEDTPAAD